MSPSPENDGWGSNGEDTLLDYLFQTGAVDPRTSSTFEEIDQLWNEYGAFRQHSRLVFRIHFLRRSSRFIGSQAVIAADNNGVEVSLPGLRLDEQQRIDRALALWRADERIATPMPYQDFVHVVTHGRTFDRNGLPHLPADLADGGAYDIYVPCTKEL